MTTRPPLDLTPERGLIFRITHHTNLAWILDHGLECRNGPNPDPNFTSIGLTELIGKRHHQVVPVPPGGTLSDYVPFYFTPLSPMLLNIKTGRHGVIRRTNEEIVMLLTSVHRLVRHEVPFLFTHGHASAQGAEFFDDVAHLSGIDWSILRARDFSRTFDDPRKPERYMAEALVHEALPIASIMGIGCSCEATAADAKTLVEKRKLDLPIFVRRGWYF